LSDVKKPVTDEMIHAVSDLLEDGSDIHEAYELSFDAMVWVYLSCAFNMVLYYSQDGHELDAIAELRRMFDVMTSNEDGSITALIEQRQMDKKMEGSFHGPGHA
jgi:plasmid replication initiation protein